MLTLLILGVLASAPAQTDVTSREAGNGVVAAGSLTLVPRVRPFALAFAPRELKPSWAEAPVPADVARGDAAKFECRIRIIEADPRFDPKIVRPTETGFDAKIVRPSRCRK